MTDGGSLNKTPDEAQDSAPEGATPKGMSPYATGGGGVTFERKVAVGYLAHLLVGDGATELGDERRVVSVAFQQAPDHSVDDLVVAAAGADEVQPPLVLAVAVRRAPDLVRSDESTQKLIRDFVSAVIKTQTDGLEHRFALIVAGPRAQAKQLSILADLAVDQVHGTAFFDLVHTPKKYAADVRGRLDQLEWLVKRALVDFAGNEPSDALVQQRTWELLARLTVLMPRLEAPDETDWRRVVNSLTAVARGGDLAGASRLRDRLVALANEYPTKAAVVDLTVLRRDAHTALDSSLRRHKQGWRALDHLNDRARSSVQDHITTGDGARRLHLDRRDVATPIIKSATSITAVVAHGESGVGKSALVFGAATGDPAATQAVCINLRHVPRTTLEFESILGCRLTMLLAELSAPQRLLIIDGADAVAEGMLDHLRFLIAGARSAGVGVIAIAATDHKQVVRDTVAEQFGTHVAEHVVPGLTDAQIEEVVATFGELANLAENPRSRELLRRPVVIDLLLRGGVSGLPLSDADAMQQVWRGLVRRHERSDHGTPDARNVAMLRLADLELSGGDPLGAVEASDPIALEGLRRDGVLRNPTDDPFKIGPEFAHDELRRYAVARLLLADADPTTKLLRVGVPRWALAAARLACQALLAAPDTARNPVSGRFARLQGAFDALVDTGHGERWGNVPGEALLTLGNPDPVLEDAWVELRAEEDKDLRRLGRLVDQRLRDQNNQIRIPPAESLVSLLLTDEAPWTSGEHVREILRGWLRAHVVANTAAGHPVRVVLRDCLVAACMAADRRLQEHRRAAAATGTVGSSKEIDEEQESMPGEELLYSEIGWPRSRRRRPEVPWEITDETVVELLALLGPDLGEDGESILRRIGRDEPARLAPAVEEFLTGRALASYGKGILSEVTEAYYIDEDEDGSGFHEYGIRRHHSRSLGVTPLAAWFRGPFTPLFQSDFRNGVALLNRMLNRAAVVRARTLAGLRLGYGAPVSDSDVDEFRFEFDIGGTRRVIVGDGQVWSWYRGMGVGPYPCMSALQALERVCDQGITMGWPMATVIALMLDGCENLAMLGLVVGFLVRHLERAERQLDPYLAEPTIWHLEFNRAVSESSGFAANSDGMVNAERRSWSMREAAMYLVVHADATRAAELRMIGKQLVERAQRVMPSAAEDEDEGAVDAVDAVRDEQLATVRAWASVLDRGTYRARKTEAGLYIESTPPESVVQTLERSNEDLRRGREVTRLVVRYHIEPKNGMAQDVPAEELAADVEVARELLDDPPQRSAGSPWDAATAVVAAALSAHLLEGVQLTDDLLAFAVDTVLRVAAGGGSPREFESEESYFEQQADRSAARTLPLLLLPSARPLLALVDDRDGSSTFDRVIAAGTNLAGAVAHEVRLHLARGLDRVWQSRCAEDGRCHHEVALRFAIESMRDSVFGEWDPGLGRRHAHMLDDPVEEALAKIPDGSIYVSRLDGVIRALAPAAVANICVSSRARNVLDVALAAQRRSLLAFQRNVDQRGSHALVAARATLVLLSLGDHAPIFDYVDAFANAPTLLGSFLRALSSAAEEADERAAAARDVWPAVVARVLELDESGHAPFSERHSGERALAALLPNAASEISYLYRELEGDPIAWWDPLAWRAIVERWLRVAAGNPTCVDQLISFLSPLPLEDRVRNGLPWVCRLVLASPGQVGRGSFLVSTWLMETRAAATEMGLLPDWQRVVDALVVAGVGRLAPYSE